MFGPGGASGSYTLVMPERCIPCEIIICERYTNGAALLLSLAKQHECRYGRHSEPPFQKRLCIMFGPGCSSGPYTLVMPERCIPCERIICERYTNGAALPALVRKLNMIYECRYGRHSEPPFLKRCLACIGHMAHRGSRGKPAMVSSFQIFSQTLHAM